MSPWTSDALVDFCWSFNPPLTQSNIKLVTPELTAFQYDAAGGTLYGYTIDNLHAKTAHFIHTLETFDPNEVKLKLARMACHLLIDLTPSQGLEEMAGKVAEIRDYYCSVADWQRPALGPEISVPFNPAMVTYQREPFVLSEE